MTDYRRLRVALLGAGAVGSQVASLLRKHGDELADRAGATLELVGIAVRDIDAPRDADFPRELLTTDAETLIIGADIVIELMGGIEPAREYLLQAINSGADVVTANKALLATHGPEIFDAADQVGAQVYYEAAAAGAIPIIRPLRDSLAGDRVQRIMGIVNGTTNYILDRMDKEGAELEDVLADAQRLGYAEADPDGRCRRVRRGAEGRDPREPRLPHHGPARRRPPRGHHRHRQGDDGCRAPRRLRHQAARRLRAADGRRGGDLRARVSGPHRPRSSARDGPRRQQRRVRRRPRRPAT